MTNSIAVVGLPKSATFFTVSTISRATGLPVSRPSCPGTVDQQLDAERFHAFSETGGVAWLHIPPTPFNVGLLKAYGTDRLALIVRDPRDAIVSWFHHRARFDAANYGHMQSVASGLYPMNWYTLDHSARMDAVISGAFPRFQSWLSAWADLLNAPPFAIHLMRYEDSAPAQPRLSNPCSLFLAVTSRSTFPITGMKNVTA